MEEEGAAPALTLSAGEGNGSRQQRVQLAAPRPVQLGRGAAGGRGR